jgi:lysophospholipase L1-like esterase
MNNLKKLGKNLPFKTAAILLPFILLVAIELLMRRSGYGYSTDLFVEDNTGACYRMNPDISKKYFAVEENATVGNRELFDKRKKDGAVRIFVLGASSSIGFPYMHNGAFPRLLKYKLQFAYPAADIEVINLSLTAVNSYTLYDFAKQLVKYSPDAVLIYAGHNEYYGASGAGSTSRAGGNRTWIRATFEARKLKIVQALFRITAKLKSTDARITDYRLTLMERMAAEQSIAYRSPMFCRGIEQFRHNMEDMLDVLTGHKIPVFIATIVSNQRSLKPFVSSPDSLNAYEQYEKGNRAYAGGDYAAAKERYILAKEYDELRFRAPEEINAVIRSLPRGREHVRLVDVLEQFERHSPRGILDSTLLLEHVHPNLAGQKLIAETFYKEITTSGLLPSISAPAFADATPTDYPLTACDSILGAISILLLKELWPFNEPLPAADASAVKTREEELAGAIAVRQITWYDAMRQLYGYYAQNGRKADALRVMESLVLEFPFSEEYLLQAGKLSLSQNQDRKAWFYFAKLDRLKPSSEAASNLAIALLKMDMTSEAMPYIERVVQDRSSPVDFAPLKEVTARIIALKQQLSAGASDASALRKSIADNYALTGNDKAASVYLDH